MYLMAELSNRYFQVLTIEQISCNLKTIVFTGFCLNRCEEASAIVMVVDCWIFESLLAISKIGLNFSVWLLQALFSMIHNFEG